MSDEIQAAEGAEAADTGAEDVGAEGGVAEVGEQQQGQQAAGEPKRVRASHWTALQKELGSVKESFTKAQQEWQAREAARERELSEMRGYLQAQREAAERNKAPEPQGPSAADLFRDAKKALDANDLDTYHQKLAEANSAIVLEKVKGMLPKEQPRQAQQPQMDPVVAGMYAQYAVQVQDQQRFQQIAALQDQMLHIKGIPPSYDRYRLALESAVRELGGGQAKTPTYSQGIAGALSAPPSRPANAQARETVEERPLTAEERAAAEWLGGEKEYRKYMSK